MTSLQKDSRLEMWRKRSEEEAGDVGLSRVFLPLALITHREARAHNYLCEHTEDVFQEISQKESDREKRETSTKS